MVVACRETESRETFENVSRHFWDSKKEVLENVARTLRINGARARSYCVQRLSARAQRSHGVPEEIAYEGVKRLKQVIQRRWRWDAIRIKRYVRELPEDHFDYLVNEAEEVDPKARALADHLDVPVETIENEDGNLYEACGSEWLVCDEDEANAAWDEDLDYYLEELVLPDLPESARQFFDGERWKDKARLDGRGHSLSRWDGAEVSVTDPVTREAFYAYRQ